MGPGGAAIAAAARVEVVFQHPHHLLFGVLNVASRPSEVKVALIGRRIPELLELLRVRYSTGTHSDAKIRSARDFLVPRSSLRRPPRRHSRCKKLSTFEPTRHRNRSEALGTGVRLYETTCLPAWQPDRTNWCHGSPAQHAWSLLQRGKPPSRPDGPGRPNRQPSPLTATFLMLSRSRGAIGRVLATPGAPSTAGGRTMDGPDGRRFKSPWQGRGFNK